MKTKLERPRVRTTLAGALDPVVINHAIERRLELAWTAENLEAIERSVGAVNFAGIEEAIAFTSNHEAWLSASTLSAAADRVSVALGQHYPWLSDRAIFQLVRQSCHGWR